MERETPLTVTASWFSLTWVTARTAAITEPHVDGFIRANLWYLRGRERDLLVDTGNGIAPVRPVLERLSRGGTRDIVALATHAHIDHVGGLHEFERRLLHPAETDAAARIGDQAPLATADWPHTLKERLADNGYILPSLLVDALPHPGFDPAAFRITPAAPTYFVQGGDMIDLGGRRLTVIELPGHTRGSIGLLDEEENALLAGDAVYEGQLIDTLPESDVALYTRTMERLLALPVDAVYPGHGAPFGRDTLRAIARAYLRRAER